METLAHVSYVLGGLSYLLLSLYTNRRLNPTLHTQILSAACLITALWCFINSALISVEQSPVKLIVESLRNGLWFIYLLSTLFPNKKPWSLRNLPIHSPWILVLVLASTDAISYLLHYENPQWHAIALSINSWATIFTTIFALIIIEQTYRNTDVANITNMRYIYFGILGLFSYDLYNYVWAFMFHEQDPAQWYSRGIIAFMTAILILIGVNQGRGRNQQISVSRQVVFYSTSLVITGLFLLALAAGGYYLKLAGGSWGGLLQSVFVFSLCALLSLVVSSKKSRAYTRVIISKHLFRHKYDYREEWLRLIDTLTKNTSENIYQRSIKAFSQIFNSSGGAVWLLHDQKAYIPVAHASFHKDNLCEMDHQEPMIQYLSEERKVIVIKEWIDYPERYNNIPAPACLKHQSVWAIIPLLNQERLTGFIALTPPEAEYKLNWEDFDLLNTVGLQIASFLAAEQASQDLMEAKQFDAYSKLTAFIMHDLKNLIAQQSLVVKNAAKHKDNPAFIEDAIGTIDNSVKRMNSLLDQLRQDHEIEKPKAIELNQVLIDAVKKCHNREPRPSITLPKEQYYINSSAEQLSMIIGHVIRNAQDATASDGFIDVTLSRENNQAVLTVEDNGTGMSAEFIRERLFKPFDSTKASKGMGIGAYQVREFIRQAGGNVHIESEPEQGSCFTISLPLELRQNEQDKTSHQPDKMLAS
jgi:putative PEP-CTERM system histidine kinase